MGFFLFNWISGLWHTIKVKVAPVVVGILEVLKGAEDNGVVDGIAKVLDGMLKTHLLEDINAVVKKQITSAIAVFVGIEDLPDNATEADVLKFSQDVVTAILGKAALDSIPGQTYTNLGAQIYDIIKKSIDAHKLAKTPVSFAEIATDIEEAYQAYLNDKAAAAATQAEPAAETQS